MEGILSGVFNCTHSNFGLCRRNYKFHQKEVKFFYKKFEKHPLIMNRCFSHIKLMD